MHSRILKAKHHSLRAIKHVRKNRHKYAFGIFGSFAIVKTILLFAGFIGSIAIMHTHAEYENFCVDNALSLDVPIEECQALIDLYNATNGSGWIDNTNRGVFTDVCTWAGIGCTGTTPKHVSSILLKNNRLSGTLLPDSLSGLIYMESFQIYNDHTSPQTNRSVINAPLPASWSSRTGILIFNVQYLGLTGTLPTERDSRTDITNFMVNNNGLTGTLPTTRSSRTNIQTFDVSYNQFNGTLPTERDSRTDIQYFVVNDNQLSGTLPTTWSSRTNITEFRVNNNFLLGYVPGIYESTWQTGARSTSNYRYIDNNCMKKLADPFGLPTLTGWLDTYRGSRKTQNVCGLFTGTTYPGIQVTSGSIYDTGVSIVYSNPNLSGATLNGVPYAVDEAITDNGHYVFTMMDSIGDTTGVSFTIDTSGPTQVMLVSPESGSEFVLTTTIVSGYLQREASIDSGFGISGYIYEISGASYHHTGFTSDTGVLVSSSFLDEGMYERWVYAIDNNGYIGAQSEIWNFTLLSFCEENRDNDYFISGAFRDLNPTSSDIICALYGTGSEDTTAYTQLRNEDRTGQCNIGNMEVRFITGGEEKIESPTPPNVIYVLENGEYIQSGFIDLDICSAIIGKTGTINIYSMNWTNYGIYMYNSTGNLFNILDSIIIDGANDGYEGPQATDDHGIYVKGNNHTIHQVTTSGNDIGIFEYETNYGMIRNSVSHNNSDKGIAIRNSKYLYISGSDIFHNTYGIKEYLKTPDINSYITYNTIHDNKLDGIAIRGSGWINLIQENQIFNNTIGISIYGSGVIITGNSIYDNTQFGIYGENSSYNTISNNIIYDNIVGIIFATGTYTTIDNNYIYNNSGIGIYLQQDSDNNILEYNYIFNNTGGGMTIRESSWNIVNNSHIFNNIGDPATSVGLFVQESDYTTINNTQVYNNMHGIDIWGNNNSIHNSQCFNNNGGGIAYVMGGTGNSMHNIQSYNNAGGIILMMDGTSPTYYGSNYVFDNAINISGTLLPGSGSDYPGLGWTDGEIIETGILSRDYFSNPKNENAFLLPFIGYDFDDFIGPQTFDITLPIVISYGTGIMIQQQPVYYSGTDLLLGGNYDSTKYIGGTTTKITGDLLLPTTTPSLGITVTGISFSPLATKYGIGGDITNFYSNIPIGTSTGIVLEDSLPDTKKIVAILYDNPDQDGFMTHFQKDTIIDTIIDCATRWDNDNFITGAFRAGDPTDENIICALYGTGPGDTTAYTQFRSGWDTTQCSGVEMDVIYTDNFTTPTLAENTIYVMTDSYSTGNMEITMANCSAVVSKNTTGTLFQSTVTLSSGMFYAYAKEYTIFDNLSLNGTGGVGVPSHPRNTYGIYYQLSHNNTIHALQSFNNDDGIFYSGSNNNTLNTTQTYNNINIGIHYFSRSNNNFMNNVQNYNNNVGIAYSYSSNYNTINNTQNYANDYVGIDYYDSHHNTINNTQNYNNYYGMHYNASHDNIINATQNYNNTEGIFFEISATGNKYYGTNNIFSNTTNIVGTLSNLTTGSSSDYPGIFSDGILDLSGILSWNLITNPLNTDGDYLLPRTGTWAGIRGRKTSYLDTTTNAYSYGSGILTQIQPVYYSGTTLKTGGSFDANTYIGSDTVRTTGYLTGLPTTTSGTSRTVSGNSANPYISQYSLFGDIVDEKIGIDIGETTGITLLSDDGDKRIVTQLFGIDYFATHFQEDAILDQTAPAFVFDNGTGIESEPGFLFVSGAIDTGVGLSSTPYSWSTDGDTRGDRTDTTGISLSIQDEPGSQTIWIRVRDDLGNISTGTAIFTWINAAPADTALGNNGPVSEGNIITRLGSAIDTGSTLSYRRYSGYDCSSFLNSGTDDSFTGSLDVPGTLVISLMVYDQQGSGGICVTSTGTRANIAPTTEPKNNSPQDENSTITRMGNTSDFGETDFSYQRYYDDICSDPIAGATGESLDVFSNEPGSTGRYFIVTDTLGSGSICTGTVGVRNNIAPTAHNLFQTGDEHSSITFIASGSDPGGTTNTGYARFSGDSCDGDILSTGEIFVFTSTIPQTLVRSYMIYDAQGIGSNCAIATGTWISTCGDTITQSYEQCDGEIGCSASCTREPVSCDLTLSGTIYSGNENTIIGNVGDSWMVISGMNFGLPNQRYTLNYTGDYTTGHLYYSGGEYTVTMYVFNPSNSGINDTCTQNVSVQYCGDGENNGSEQCDGEIGCSESCTWNTDFYCTIELSGTIYSGDTNTITGNLSSGWVVVSGINFGLPDLQYILYHTGDYTTVHTYYSGGSYTVTMYIAHPDDSSITGSCTKNVTVQYCGDGETNGSEQCDDGNNESDDGCSDLCTLETPSCSLSIAPLAGYAPLTGILTLSNIDTGWMDFDFLDFGDGTTGDVDTGTLDYSHLYATIGAFTGTFQVSNIYSGAITGQCSANIQVANFCEENRNNDYFLSGAFRDLNPTSGNIICALYGSGPGDTTAYTQTWEERDTTQCSGIEMTVIEVDTLPEYFQDNTIYILTGTATIIDEKINMGTCSAIVSRNKGNTIIFSAESVPENTGSMISIQNEHIILDNIGFDGMHDGDGGIHARNQKGIDIFASSYTTINNNQFYNTIDGIVIGYSSNNITLHNSFFYNNNKGILIYHIDSRNTVINNCQIYNNLFGIWDNGKDIIINNSSIYNNGQGLRVSSSSTGNVVSNNNQFYNNIQAIITYTASTIFINDTNMYNNTGTIDSDGTSYFYGTNNIFNNGTGITIETGHASDPIATTLGWDDGVMIDTGIMTRDLITNPMDTSGNYLLSRSGSRTNLRGKKATYVNLPTERYSFGSGTSLQTEIIVYSGASFTTIGPFDSSKYIGSDRVKTIGYLAGLPTTTSGTSRTVSGNSTDPSISRYSIFGDIVDEIIDVDIGDNTGLILASGYGEKRIITQLYGPDHFAMHFQNSINLSDVIPYCGDGIKNGDEQCDPNDTTNHSGRGNNGCSVSCIAKNTGGPGPSGPNTDDCKLPSNLACANAEGIDHSYSYYDNTCCSTAHEAPSLIGWGCRYSDEEYQDNGAFKDTIGNRAFSYIETLRINCIHRGRWDKSTYKSIPWKYYPSSSATIAEIMKTYVKLYGIATDTLDITKEENPYPGKTPFADIPKTHRASWYAQTAYEKGLLEGMYTKSKGKLYLNPDRLATREDVVAIMMRTYGSIYKNFNFQAISHFADVKKSDPYYLYIAAAEELGFIEGYTGANGLRDFRGSANITRAEFAKLIALPFHEQLLVDINTTILNSDIYQEIVSIVKQTKSDKIVFINTLIKKMEQLDEQYILSTFKVSKEKFLDVLRMLLIANEEQK